MTSIRSCAPVWNSNNRFAPVADVPNSVVITRIAGTNHCQTPPPSEPPIDPDSSGPNSARNTSGWIIPNSKVNGSRRTGFSSRVITIRMSRSRFRDGCSAVTIGVVETVRVVIRLPFRSSLPAGCGR